MCSLIKSDRPYLFLFFYFSENDGKVQMKFDVLGEGEVSVPSHFFKVNL